MAGKNSPVGRKLEQTRAKKESSDQRCSREAHGDSGRTKEIHSSDGGICPKDNDQLCKEKAIVRTVRSPIYKFARHHMGDSAITWRKVLELVDTKSLWALNAKHYGW